MGNKAEQEESAEQETAADRLYRKFVTALEEEGLFVTDESKDVISNLLDCLVEMHEESQPLTEMKEEDDVESENAGSAPGGEAQEED